MGIFVRYLGEDENGNVAGDCTIGEIYEIVGVDSSMDYYFIDDSGDRNYEANNDGFGKFCPVFGA